MASNNTHTHTHTQDTRGTPTQLLSGISEQDTVEPSNESHHFINYLCKNGNLYELDGSKESPVLISRVSYHQDQQAFEENRARMEQIKELREEIGHYSTLEGLYLIEKIQECNAIPKSVTLIEELQRCKDLLKSAARRRTAERRRARVSHSSERSNGASKPGNNQKELH